MPFRNRNRLRPINTIKHITDRQGGAGIGVPANEILVRGAINPDITTDTSVVEAGSKIFSMFLNVQVIATSSAALGNAYFILYKNPGNNIPAASIPNANATGASDFRRQIFHTEMAMLSDENDSIPITLFKGVLKVPRTFQTMRQEDEIVIQIFTPGVTIDYCVECIYKEVR